MKSTQGIDLGEVRAAYEGREGRIYDLIMGQLIHVGGFRSSMDLGERAGVVAGSRGVDLCCGNGAGMRFLVRFRDVASLTGVDAASTQVERGRRLCDEEGLGERIVFVHGDASDTGLPDAEADFVWGEDAWCYVADKLKLLAEAARLVRPGGTIAFTDWVEGPEGLERAEAERFLALMRFPNLESVGGYRRLLEKQGCEVLEAEDTGRLARYFGLYRDMLDLQLAYDALAIVDYSEDALRALLDGLDLVRRLAQAGKVAQARFVARRA